MFSRRTTAAQPVLSRKVVFECMRDKDPEVPQIKSLAQQEARAIIDDLYLMGEDPHIDLIRAAAGRKLEADPLKGLHDLWYID